MIEIKLPEIGDGIESGDVLEVLVRVGDVIEAGQDIIELETDKATTGIPATHSGRVVEIHVQEGDTAPIGSVLVTVEQTDSASAATVDAPKVEPPAAPPSSQQENQATEPQPTSESVAETPSADPEPPEPVETPTPAPAPKTVEVAAQSTTTKSEGADPSAIAAGPSIRRFARELGVDLRHVVGSGKKGRITREDVLATVRKANAQTGPAGEDPTEGDAWGPTQRQKLSRIRRAIATKMEESWSTCPRVTNFDDANVSELEEFRQASKADYARQGIKLTSTPFVIKAVAMSLKANPVVNSSLDLANNEMVFREYVNIGIAMDTERGLVVPSLRQADELSVFEIAVELKRIVDEVRNNDFKPEDLRGSTFTISNLGAIGGTYSTPIINVPEVAILLLGRSRKMPIVVDDQVAVRLMMPLSLSYDHRVVDGADAARFLNDLIQYLETPSRLLLGP